VTFWKESEMGLEKTEVKMAAVHEVGMKLDDFLEAAKREVAETNGAQTMARIVGQRLMERSKALDVAFQAAGNTLEKETYDALKKVWSEALTVAGTLAKSSEEQFYRCQGKVSALEASVKMTKAMHDASLGKLRAIAEGSLVLEESGQLPGQAPGDAAVIPMRREVGTHPGNPLAALHARGTEPKPSEEPPKAKKPRKQPRKPKEV
jgi:hypothetical protein